MSGSTLEHPVIVAKVRVQPADGPEDEWLIPMWHGEGRHYRSWLPFAVGTPYEVTEIIAALDTINEVRLDYSVAEHLLHLVPHPVG